MICRWFSPLRDLVMSRYLVPNTKLAEGDIIQSNDRGRLPFQPLQDIERERAEKMISDALATRARRLSSA